MAPGVHLSQPDNLEAQCMECQAWNTHNYVVSCAMCSSLKAQLCLDRVVLP